VSVELETRDKETKKQGHRDTSNKTQVSLGVLRWAEGVLYSLELGALHAA
jgi:hypothetical protein